MIGSEYTINGVTYRNLEAQVARNQELSLESAQKATEATNKINEFQTTVTQGFEQVLEQINQQEEEFNEAIADVRNDIKSYTLINQQVYTSANNPVPNAIWEGKLWADGTFDVYTIISGTYEADYSGSYYKNVNQAVTGNADESIVLPIAIPSTIVGSKEVIIINNISNESGYIVYAELSANKNITSSQTRFYVANSLYTGNPYPFQLIIHVHGKAII